MDWEDRQEKGYRDGLAGRKAASSNSMYMDAYNMGKKEFLKREGKNYE
jgi:hypothetical protein